MPEIAGVEGIRLTVLLDILVNSVFAECTPENIDYMYRLSQADNALAKEKPERVYGSIGIPGVTLSNHGGTRLRYRKAGMKTKSLPIRRRRTVLHCTQRLYMEGQLEDEGDANDDENDSEVDDSNNVENNDKENEDPEELPEDEDAESLHEVWVTSADDMHDGYITIWGSMLSNI